MADFVDFYNTEHLHSSIGYVTPEQKRYGKSEDIFRKRNRVMQKVRVENPEAWGNGKMKIWGAPETVFLNPEN